MKGGFAHRALSDSRTAGGGAFNEGGGRTATPTPTTTIPSRFPPFSRPPSSLRLQYIHHGGRWAIHAPSKAPASNAREFGTQTTWGASRSDSSMAIEGKAEYPFTWSLLLTPAAERTPTAAAASAFTSRRRRRRRRRRLGPGLDRRRLLERCWLQARRVAAAGRACGRCAVAGRGRGRCGAAVAGGRRHAAMPSAPGNSGRCVRIFIDHIPHPPDWLIASRERHIARHVDTPSSRPLLLQDLSGGRLQIQVLDPLTAITLRCPSKRIHICFLFRGRHLPRAHSVDWVRGVPGIIRGPIVLGFALDSAHHSTVHRSIS